MIKTKFLRLSSLFTSSLFSKRFYKTRAIELYQRCFSILGVNEHSDQCEVRQAYLELVKKVHPDSGMPEASAEKFKQIDEAFKILQEKFAKNRRGIYDDDEELKDYQIRHTVPQHRQYLEYDGLGIGTPSQRQKQYQQIKAMGAQSKVVDHRLEKAKAGEKTLMKKGQYHKKHAIKTKHGFDRVVEDLIQEAMSKGDFDNLKGAGKPLALTQSQNPYVDFTTHKLNKIMLDNGFTPEWITLQKEIREEIKNIRKLLSNYRSQFGDNPLNAKEQYKWSNILDNHKKDVDAINKKIDKYNLLAPIMNNQLFRLNYEKLGNEILNDDTIPRNVVLEKTSTEHQTVVRSYKDDFFSFLQSMF